MRDIKKVSINCGGIITMILVIQAAFILGKAFGVGDVATWPWVYVFSPFIAVIAVVTVATVFGIALSLLLRRPY